MRHPITISGQSKRIEINGRSLNVFYVVSAHVNSGDASVGERPFVEDLRMQIKGAMVGDVFWNAKGLAVPGFDLREIEDEVREKVKEENLEQLVIDAYYQDRAESRAGLRRLRMG